MKKPDSLIQTAKDFDDWRNQRPHQGVPIPDSLRYRAIQLLESYTTSQVTKSLRVCGSQLKSWRQQFVHHSEEKSECPFVISIITPGNRAGVTKALHRGYLSKDQLIDNINDNPHCNHPCKL